MHIPLSSGGWGGGGEGGWSIVELYESFCQFICWFQKTPYFILCSLSLVSDVEKELIFNSNSKDYFWVLLHVYRQWTDASQFCVLSFFTFSKKGQIYPCIYAERYSIESLSFFGRSTSGRQRPMKSLSFVCPYVCLSVRQWLSFLKIGSVVFSDNVQDNSWSWYQVTD